MVTAENGIVLGDLRGKALEAKPETPVEQVMDPAPSSYRPSVSVHEMMHELLDSNARRVLVTDGDGRLIGWLSRDDVQAALETHEAQPGEGPILASTH